MMSMDCSGKEGAGSRKRNLALLRSKLYMGERRKTEPVVESTASTGDHGTLRRSQSDRTEYSQKLQGTREACLVPGCEGCCGLGWYLRDALGWGILMLSRLQPPVKEGNGSLCPHALTVTNCPLSPLPLTSRVEMSPLFFSK